MSRKHLAFELLIIVALFGVFLFVIVIAINPFRQWSHANNIKRYTDVVSILNAVDQYASAHEGNITQLHIPKVVAGEISSQGISICSQLVPQYLAALPEDPKINKGDPISDCFQIYDTGYTIIQDPKYLRITVAAPDAELSQTIEVTQ